MSHLDDAQFEALLRGGEPEPEHLRNCAACRAELAGRRALAERLRGAFATVHAPEALRRRLEAATGVSSAAPRVVRLSRGRRVGSLLAAAAVVVLCVLPMHLFQGIGSEARAAQQALSAIHHLSLADPNRLLHSQDPDQIADHLEARTGLRPTVIHPDDDCVVCGARACTFRGRTVPTYLVDTPAGRVSVVVLTETPRQLGMTENDGLGCWTATCACCHMAARRLGLETYYALGEVPHAVLAQVLARLTL